MKIVPPYQGKILTKLHDKLPAACWRIYRTIDDLALTELIKIYCEMQRTFKPKENGLSLDSYFFRYAPMRLVRVFLRRYRPILYEVRMEDYYRDCCEDDDRDGVVRHKYGRWNEPLANSIYHEIELNDLIDEIEQIAMYTGLGGITRYAIEGMSQREIAKEMKLPRGTLQKRLAKLRKVLQKMKIMGTRIYKTSE